MARAMFHAANPPRRNSHMLSPARIRAPIATIRSLPEFRPLPSFTSCWLRRRLAAGARRGYHI